MFVLGQCLSTGLKQIRVIRMNCQALHYSVSLLVLIFIFLSFIYMNNKDKIKTGVESRSVEPISKRPFGVTVLKLAQFI